MKEINKVAEHLYRENNYQSANIFIVTGAIFLATLTIRNIWTNIAQLAIILSVVQIFLGVSIILLLRLQIFLQSKNKTSDVAESIFFSCIASGFTFLLVNFILLMLVLFGR